MVVFFGSYFPTLSWVLTLSEITDFRYRYIPVVTSTPTRLLRSSPQIIGIHRNGFLRWYHLKTSWNGQCFLQTLEEKNKLERDRNQSLWTSQSLHKPPIHASTSYTGLCAAETGHTTSGSLRLLQLLEPWSYHAVSRPVLKTISPSVDPLWSLRWTKRRGAIIWKKGENLKYSCEENFVN